LIKTPAYSLSFDIDFKQDVFAVPKVLTILKKHKIKSSFACIGIWIEKYPEIHRRIVHEGHEIINHTYSHPNNDELSSKVFAKLNKEQKRKEIIKCHETCKNLLNYEPIGFRCPHFGKLYSKKDSMILKEIGYKYSSSTISFLTPKFGAPYKNKGIWEFPLFTSQSHPATLFDSWSSRTGPKKVFESDSKFIREFILILNNLKTKNAYVSHYFDPCDIIKNNKLSIMCREIIKTNIKMYTYKELVHIVENVR